MPGIHYDTGPCATLLRYTGNQVGGTSIKKSNPDIYPNVHWDGANDFAWYSGTLTLTEKSMKEVAVILSKLFNRKIDVAPAIASCTLSAKIEYETIDDILNIIAETLGIEWKDESNKIYIYGKGC